MTGGLEGDCHSQHRGKKVFVCLQKNSTPYKEKNILVVAGGKKVAFHREEDVRRYLQEIGWTFLCNMIVNSSLMYEHVNNLIILNLEMRSDLMKCVSIHPTMFGLGTEMRKQVADLDLSSDDDEDNDFFCRCYMLKKQKSRTTQTETIFALSVQTCEKRLQNTQMKKTSQRNIR